MVLVAALLGVGLYAALPALSGLPALRTWVAGRLQRATNWRVQLAGLRLNRDLSLTLASLAVAQPERPPFLTVERLDIALRPLGLFSGHPLRIRAEGPHLHMGELPSGATAGGGGGPATLAHAEIVDGYLHFPSGERAVLGPLTLTVDAAHGAAQQVTLGGRGQLPGESGSLSWSAELGATLEQSHGTFDLNTAAPLVALRPWLDIAVPPEVAPTAATLRITWRGTERGRLALDVDSEWHVPLSDAPLHFAGDGEVDPSTRNARLTLTSKQLAIRSADATRAASGVELRLGLVAQPSEAGTQLDFTLAVPKGEVLWDRFYADLHAFPVALRGSIDSSPQQLTLSRATLSIDGVGTATGSGSYHLDDAQQHWRAEFELPGLDTVYRLAVREPLQADYPALARLEVRGRARGAIDQDRSGSNPGRFTGHLDLSNVSLNSSQPQIAVPALDAHVPLDLGEDGDGGGAQGGSVQMNGAMIGNVPIGDVDIRLRVEPNRIAVAEPVRIAMLGGTLEIADLRASKLMSDDPQASLALALQDLQLSEVSRALGWPPLNGAMRGSIPAVTIDRHNLQSQGEILIEAFGGKARVDHLHIEELFSRVPTVRLDVEASDISLTELTSTFEIGRISGVANASIRDLQIADGQPVHFDASMETVPKPGVPQRVSVTAIRQLSILGGSGGDPISLGVLSFFDEYRYAKMGFRCRLENDRFELHGVEVDDEVDYLVVGATLPPRVNVISHTREISFTELMRRLSRVFALRQSPLRSTDAGAAPAEGAGS